MNARTFARTVSVTDNAATPLSTSATVTVNLTNVNEAANNLPPVVNDPVITELLREAMAVRCGAESVEDTEQSLGGEDFSWYLEHVPGAMARLQPKPNVPMALHAPRGPYLLVQDLLVQGMLKAVAPPAGAIRPHGQARVVEKVLLRR